MNHGSNRINPMRQPSFGKYFDDQRDRMIAALQNKNTQQNIEWRERYDDRRKKWE